MARARTPRPDPFQVAFEAAVAAHRAGDLAGAIAAYEKLVKRGPAHAGVLANLATALKQAGRRDEALDAFRRVVAAKGAPAEAWFNYANLLAELGRAEEAEAAYRETLARDPKQFRAATNLANLLVRLKRADEALALHRQALELAPDNVASLRAAARLHYGRGELEESERLYRRALAAAPDHPDTLSALGVVLQELGRRDEAVECWTRAIARDPGHALARSNLGVMLRLMRRLPEAVAQLREAVRLQPRDATFAGNLAHALLELGQTTEAERLARGILARDPADATGHMMLGFSLAYQGEVEPAIDAFLAAHRSEPAAQPVIANALFASLYSDRRDAQAVLDLHRELAARIAPALPPRVSWPNDRDPGRRLKVGYLSPDLRTHPVAFFFEPILARHDRDRFETVCYSTTSAPDAVTARLREQAATWRDCAGWTDARIAEHIARDGIDILVDLAGHTAQNRAGVMRAKVAPVQVMYIGYPGSTGLPEMDYLVADARICPPEMDRYYSERVARLPGSFWCFQPRADAPAVAPLPARRNGHVTFGSYNALQKLTPVTVALWARVLAAAPGSRLLLKSLAFADEALGAAIRRRFAAAGADPSRVDIAPPTEGAQFLAEYGRVDIGLDPFPYNGGTTTCEAMWMGVPVVTRAGLRFCSRMGLALLESVGLPELVARDADDYVRICAALAADLPRLEALRAGLRARMAASPACDAARTTRELEEAYRGMWRSWVNKG